MDGVRWMDSTSADAETQLRNWEVKVKHCTVYPLPCTDVREHNINMCKTADTCKPTTKAD